ncbi:hypothetical protein FHG87_021307, partial [Trinorchestia longiramus]
VRLRVHPRVYLSTCPRVYLSTCLPTHVFTCPRVYLPMVCLPTCLPACTAISNTSESCHGRVLGGVRSISISCRPTDELLCSAGAGAESVVFVQQEVQKSAVFLQQEVQSLQCSCSRSPSHPLSLPHLPPSPLRLPTVSLQSPSSSPPLSPSPPSSSSPPVSFFSTFFVSLVSYSHVWTVPEEDSAQREFRRFYNLGRHGAVPSKHAKKCWNNNFQETGSTLKKKPTGRPRSARTPQNIDVVRESVLQSPRRSIRKQAVTVEMSRESVRRIVTLDLKFHPHKLQIMQQLRENDYQLRFEFCQQMISHTSNDYEFLSKLWLSDEAHFYHTGYVNDQNYRH